MIGLECLDNIQLCVETVIKENIPGDLIETGVWRGGACILMRAILKAYTDSTRTVWVADLFAGLSPLTLRTTLPMPIRNSTLTESISVYLGKKSRRTSVGMAC
jgi:hypothetical protein